MSRLSIAQAASVAIAGPMCFLALCYSHSGGKAVFAVEPFPQQNLALQLFFFAAVVKHRIPAELCSEDA